MYVKYPKCTKQTRAHVKPQLSIHNRNNSLVLCFWNNIVNFRLYRLRVSIHWQWFFFMQSSWIYQKTTWDNDIDGLLMAFFIWGSLHANSLQHPLYTQHQTFVLTANWKDGITVPTALGWHLHTRMCHVDPTRLRFTSKLNRWPQKLDCQKPFWSSKLLSLTQSVPKSGRLSTSSSSLSSSSAVLSTSASSSCSAASTYSSSSSLPAMLVLSTKSLTPRSSLGSGLGKNSERICIGKEVEPSLESSGIRFREQLDFEASLDRPTANKSQRLERMHEVFTNDTWEREVFDDDEVEWRGCPLRRFQRIKHFLPLLLHAVVRWISNSNFPSPKSSQPPQLALARNNRLGAEQKLAVLKLRKAHGVGVEQISICNKIEEKPWAEHEGLDLSRLLGFVEFLPSKNKHRAAGKRTPQDCMAWERGPSLIELGVRDSAAGDDGFVVAKHDWPINRNTEVAQRQTEINDLVGGCASGHEFGTIGGGFDRVLLLTVEINDGLINSMHNPGYGAAGDKVMVEIGVDPCRGDDGIT